MVRKRVLSIDGGGVRGIIPAMILKEIEDELQRPISSIFDLIAGTSTGGLIGASLCLPNIDGTPRYKAADIIEFYEQCAAKIFKQNWYNRIMVWFNTTKYSARRLDEILFEFCGYAEMGHALTNLVIPTYDILNSKPLDISSWNLETKRVYVKDVLRATTAAPTYFPPKRIYINNVERLLIDGGVYANNPSLTAFAYCSKLFNTNDVMMLSLCTGEEKVCLTEHQVNRFGIFNWVEPLLKIIFSANLKTNDRQMSLMIENYFRVNTELISGSTDMDDGSALNMARLKIDGERTLHANRDLIKNFCKLVLSES